MIQQVDFNVYDNLTWINSFYSYLDSYKIDYELLVADDFTLVKLINYNFIVNLVSLNNTYQAKELVNLQLAYKQKNIQLVHLWEDVWFKRKAQVMARLKSLIGGNIRIHGRKTKVLKISKPVADEFLNQNHLQGAVSSKYKLGLFLKDELVALATFSNLRKMNYPDNYTSAELIRFAVKEGYSVVGGLSKLLKFFIELKKPNDIMSYADMDWSLGDAYTTLGFNYVDKMEPRSYRLNASLERELLPEHEFTDGPRVFNTGSLKYILRCDG